MFERIGQSAEKVVNNVSVSRRGFLGTAAKLAAGVGAALAALGAFPTEAQARRVIRTNPHRPNCGCTSGYRPMCYYPRSGGGYWCMMPPDANCRCPKYIGWGCGKLAFLGCARY